MNLCLLDFCSFSSFLSSPALTAVSGDSLCVFSGTKALWSEFTIKISTGDRMETIILILLLITLSLSQAASYCIWFYIV